jgi:hypothetical protein
VVVEVVLKIHLVSVAQVAERAVYVLLFRQLVAVDHLNQQLLLQLTLHTQSLLVVVEQAALAQLEPMVTIQQQHFLQLLLPLVEVVAQVNQPLHTMVLVVVLVVEVFTLLVSVVLELQDKVMLAVIT